VPVGVGYREVNLAAPPSRLRACLGRRRGLQCVSVCPLPPSGLARGRWAPLLLPLEGEDHSVHTQSQDGRAPRWERSIAQALALVLTFTLLRAIQTRLWQHWFGATDFQETPPFALFMAGSFAIMSVGFIGGCVVRLTGTAWRELGWQREGLAKAAAWGVLGFVAVSANVLVWSLAGGATARPDYVSPSVGRLLLVAFFAFGVAAWVEENLFRGYLQPLLAKRLPISAAIAVQAALFSVAHLGYTTDLAYFGSAFVSGLILGALRGRGRSLVAPFVAHGLLWMMAAFGPTPS